MKYKCLKCGCEFDVKYEVKCPDCGAVDRDCEPLRVFKTIQPEALLEMPEMGEVILTSEL